MNKKKPEDSKVFKAGEGYGNVVLNFEPNPLDGLGPLARSFHEAGRSLLETKFSSAGYSDDDACPIFYIYRHALELYLKSIDLIALNILIIQGKEQDALIATSQIDLQGKEQKQIREGLIRWVLDDHTLKRHLDLLKKALDEVGWTWSLDIDGLRTFDDLKLFIDEIETVDPNSYTFRYLVNKKGDAYLARGFITNVLTYCHSMDAVLDTLDSDLTGLGEARQEIADMIREYSTCYQE